ncbi:hypothetical protein Plhal304r1_c047g0128701 [Plasmopara halstedii]
MPIAPKLPRSYYPRQVPTDSYLAASEAEVASLNFDALRSNALKLAPMPAASTELHPRLLQSCLIIPNAGVRFTCASYDMASNLSQVSVTAFGSTIQIARFYKYGSRYYVDLVRLPDEVTDRAIFDWLKIVNQAPDILVPSPTKPLREFLFPPLMMAWLIFVRALLTTRWHVTTGSPHHPFLCIKNKKQQKERLNKWRLHLQRPRLSRILYPGICRSHLYTRLYDSRFRRPSLR